jgi:excisionase family DNA binding protein
LTATSPARPTDATLSVTKAARLLGVHPNTIRTWSDQGRLRYYRINPRGDRRYRLGDLQGFLAAAEASEPNVEHRPDDSSHPGGSTGRTTDTATGAPRPAQRRGDRLHPASGYDRGEYAPLDRERHRLDLRVLAELAALTSGGRNLDRMLAAAVTLVQGGYGYLAVSAYERREDRLVLRAVAPAGPYPDLPAGYGTAGRALLAQRPVHLTSSDPEW